MATAAKKKTRIRTPNPTLHGLMVSRSFSGTVVRGLLFAIIVFGFVLLGTGSSTGVSGGSVLLTWLVMTVIYLVFDIIYVFMSMIRPLHLRLDRVVLPVALVFALGAIYLPIVITKDGFNVVGFWVTAAIALLCVLGVRMALLIASKK